MDAFELLKKDHERVSNLFKEIESASDQAKNDLFEQLKSELDIHAQVEETIFYAALKDAPESREITLEAYEEHNVVKELLAELADRSSEDETWDARLTVLKENVEHHVEEEEGELFNKAEDVLTQDQIEQLGNEMQAAKTKNQRANAVASTTTQSQPSSEGQPTATAAKATKRQSASKESTKKPGKKGGILSRLANLVGLGESAPKGRRAKKPASKKPATAAKASRTSARKSATKASRKAGGTKAKTARKAAPSSRATTKSTKRSAVAKSMAGKRRAAKPGKKSSKASQTTNKRGSVKRGGKKRGR